MDLALIARNDVFSAARAKAAGLDDAALRRLVRSGTCIRLHRGWYAARVPVDERDRWSLAVAAVSQEYAGRAALSHDAALLWLGLPTFGEDLTRVDLMWRSAGVAAHTARAVRVHSLPALPGFAATRRDTVSPALAVVQAGLRDQRALVIAGDAALHRNLVTAAELDLAARALSGHRGVTSARAVLRWVDGRHESPGESLTAWTLRHLGYELVPQFEVPGSEAHTASGRPLRVDFLLRGTRVVVEFDGRVKYTDSRVLFDEKVREDRIRDLGYEMVRLTWADLRDPERIRRVVEAAVARWARRRSA